MFHETLTHQQKRTSNDDDVESVGREKQDLSNKQRRLLKRKLRDEAVDLNETEITPFNEETLTEQQTTIKKKKKPKKQQELHLEPLLIATTPTTTKTILLILDINKVLISRRKGSSCYTPRPYVKEFLQEMSQHYYLAVWTSMKKSSAKKVMKELFHEHSIQLQFIWYQSRCKIIRNQLNDKLKPDFFKNLEFVWKEYPLFNASNTILMDDSEEKCVENNPTNCIHPLPFEISQVKEDNELQPLNKLWNYLIGLANYSEGLPKYVEIVGLYSWKKKN